MNTSKVERNVEFVNCFLGCFSVLVKESVQVALDLETGIEVTSSDTGFLTVDSFKKLAGTHISYDFLIVSGLL